METAAPVSGENPNSNNDGRVKREYTSSIKVPTVSPDHFLSTRIPFLFLLCCTNSPSCQNRVDDKYITYKPQRN